MAYLSETQKNELLRELQLNDGGFNTTSIAADIMEKGVDSHHLMFTDVSNQQVAIKLSDEVFIYSEQRSWPYDGVTDDEKDTGDYFAETMDFNEYRSEIEQLRAVSGYYDTIDEVKELYGDDWKQIILECDFEKIEVFYKYY